MNTKLLRLRAQYILFDIYDLFSFFVFVFGLVLLVRFFVFNPFTVVGASMQPNFTEWDFIVVDKITPRFGELERGDVIVFVPPQETVAYIKRIVGIPWETVWIKDDHIYICQWLYDKVSEAENCELLPEEYIPENFKTLAGSKKEAIFPVDEEWFFVAGDNRSNSSDSRVCFKNCYEWASYLVKTENMIGRVAFRLYPDISWF